MHKYKTLFFFVLASSFFFSNTLFVNEIDEALLENLPPDQRKAVMEKMEDKDSIEEELEEIFDSQNSLIRRPELPDEDEIPICEECIYGYDFFTFSPTTFAPTNDIPISSDYVLGPGDQLEINIFGKDNKRNVSFISREGLFVLPLLGPVNLMGMTFQDATSFLQNKVASELIGSEISVSLKKLRSMSIYVLGEAYKPGTYTISALSTVVNALFISGGVNETGSLRNVQVKRNNKIIATYDFYDFLLNGSLSSDIRLQDGDVVFIHLNHTNPLCKDDTLVTKLGWKVGKEGMKFLL